MQSLSNLGFNWLHKYSRSAIKVVAIRDCVCTHLKFVTPNYPIIPVVNNDGTCGILQVIFGIYQACPSLILSIDRISHYLVGKFVGHWVNRDSFLWALPIIVGYTLVLLPLRISNCSFFKEISQVLRCNHCLQHLSSSLLCHTIQKLFLLSFQVSSIFFPSTLFQLLIFT